MSFLVRELGTALKMFLENWTHVTLSKYVVSSNWFCRLMRRRKSCGKNYTMQPRTRLKWTRNFEVCTFCEAPIWAWHATRSKCKKNRCDSNKPKFSDSMSNCIKLPITMMISMECSSDGLINGKTHILGVPYLHPLFLFWNGQHAEMDGDREIDVWFFDCRRWGTYFRVHRITCHFTPDHK